eukprot:5895315-Amphidinium_carterae.1
MNLAEYLRYECGLTGTKIGGLTGTKIGCGEGGCGACTVLVRPAGGKDFRLANSCLRPLHAMGGVEVSTIEHLGTPQKPHPIQKSLADNSGSQCGMCTPGMVMALYGHHLKPVTERGPDESCIQGNLCRCTGYRPIYDAIRAVNGYAVEAPACAHNPAPTPKFSYAHRGDSQWIECTSLDEVFAALAGAGETLPRLVVGSTGHAVAKYYSTPDKGPTTFIHVGNVAELLEQGSSGKSLTLGSACTISMLLSALKAVVLTVPQFHALVDHLGLVAHPQVRDMASWAGNIMLAKLHPNFPSDVGLLLCLCHAELTLASASATRSVAVQEFLQNDSLVLARGEIIKSVTIPYPQENSVVKSFKVMRRKMNAHAEINMGLMCCFADGHIQRAHVVIGNVRQGPFVPVRCVAALTGAVLGSATIQSALRSLAEDLVEMSDPAIEDPPYVVASKDYRRKLALGIFYKAALQVWKSVAGEEALSMSERSAAEDFSRPQSHGTQHFTPGPSELAPLGQPGLKYQGLEQVCGTANFTADVMLHRGTLFAVPVLATNLAPVSEIDASAALSTTG